MTKATGIDPIAIYFSNIQKGKEQSINHLALKGDNFEQVKKKLKSKGYK